MIITRVNSARASLISLSVLDVAFMNRTRLISKFDFQCSCLKVSMTRHNINKFSVLNRDTSNECFDIRSNLQATVLRTIDQLSLSSFFSSSSSSSFSSIR